MRVVALSPEIEKERQVRAEELLRGKAEVVTAPSARGLVEALGRADAYLCLGFGREFPEDPRAYARLRFVQTMWAGMNRVPFDRIPADVVICSNAGAFNTSLAEHAFALLLAAAKRIVAHATDIRQGRFPQSRPGKQLRGSTLGVVGLGGIGKEVARMGQAFGMRVLGVTRSGESDFPAEFVGDPGDLHHVLAEADFVVLAVPFTRETRGMIGAAEFARMKPDGVLVNVGRGDVVREVDLFEYLKATPSFVAATDVWWRYPDGDGYPYTLPFHELPNFFGTPHVAWNVPPQHMATVRVAADNLLAWIEGRPVRNVVSRELYLKITE